MAEKTFDPKTIDRELSFAQEIGLNSIMPLLKTENIGAYNWGLVAGKTNTIYAWDTPITDGSEPDIWFHDIFRRDGSPYNQDEIDLIKSLTIEE